MKNNIVKVSSTADGTAFIHQVKSYIDQNGDSKLVIDNTVIIKQFDGHSEDVNRQNAESYLINQKYSLNQEGYYEK